MPTFRDDIRLGTKVPQMKTEDYEDSSVTTEKIADEAITESKLAEQAVTSSILGNGAVENSNIKDGSITNEKIANRTIKAFEKIARSSISQEEMGIFSVGNDELIDGSVTTEKIEDEAITNEKIAERTISEDKIVNGTISGDKIAASAISSNLIKSEAVTIEKIAAEVWGKLKDEYLRLDGENFMKSDLKLNNNRITGITELHDDKSLPSVIAFNKDGYDIKFEKYSTSGGDEGASPDFLGGINDTEFEIPLFMIADGFKTHNRTTLGLLNNNGEVVTAMTDSDIDKCIAMVFG